MACPIIAGDAAITIAGQAYTTASNRAGFAFGTAIQALNELGSLEFEPIQFNTAFGYGGNLPGIGTIPAPVIDFSRLNFVKPGVVPDAPTVSIQRQAPGFAPTFDEQPPNLVWPGTPTLIALSDPGPAPVVDLDPDMPDPPTFTMPALPTIEELNLPVAPVLEIPVFAGQRPIFDAPFPTENWDFTPEEYVSSLLDQVRAVITPMLAGEGIPAAVAAAIRSRAFLTADIEESRAAQTEIERWTRMGHDEPGGPLLKGLDQVQQAALDARQALNRDIFEREDTTARESRRFAVTAGIQLEGQLMQMHVAMQQLALEAAKFAVERAISILNARISVFNAQVAAYEADARVYRDLIQAELAKVELYRAQIQAEIARGEINAQRIELYRAQLSGIQTLVDIYRARLQAVETFVNIETAKIEAFRAKVQVLAEQVRAQTAQWDGFRAQNEGNVARMRGYEAAVNVFATRVQAYGVTEGVKDSIAELEVSVNRLRQEAHRNRLGTYETELRAETGRVTAVATAIGAETGLYEGRTRAEAARQEALNRAFNSLVERERARTDVELKRADQMLEQFRHLTGLMVSVQQSIASIAAQIGASAQSAVSVNAGLSHGVGRNQSCNESFVTNRDEE